MFALVMTARDTQANASSWQLGGGWTAVVRALQMCGQTMDGHANGCRSTNTGSPLTFERRQLPVTWLICGAIPKHCQCLNTSGTRCFGESCTSPLSCLTMSHARSLRFSPSHETGTYTNQHMTSEFSVVSAIGKSFAGCGPWAARVQACTNNELKVSKWWIPMTWCSSMQQLHVLLSTECSVSTCTGTLRMWVALNSSRTDTGPGQLSAFVSHCSDWWARYHCVSNHKSTTPNGHSPATVSPRLCQGAHCSSVPVVTASRLALI